MPWLQGLSDGQVRFFTNYTSRKADELQQNPQVAAVFHWSSLARQVRIEGRVEQLSGAESDAYFQSRERQSQLGAWASPQSRIIASREQLEARYEEVAARYPGVVPRPPHWGGYRIVAASYEFWNGRAHRLHDRVRYRRGASGWTTELLAP
jgi:pyridoxamine 5'-phosphate oxidase